MQTVRPARDGSAVLGSEPKSLLVLARVGGRTGVAQDFSDDPLLTILLQRESIHATAQSLPLSSSASFSLLFSVSI